MTRRVTAVLCALLLTATSSIASQGGPKPKPSKPQASVSKPVKPTTTTKVKTVSPKPTVSKPIKPVKSTSVKPAKSTSVKPAKSTTKAAKPVKAAKTTKTAKADGKKSTTTTTATPTSPETAPSDSTTPPAGDPVTLTKVQEKLQRNTNLASKLQGRLPEGTDLMKAAYGFKNLGQFVAAVNVSNNHDISFTKLKNLMVNEGYSLGQSIQAIKADTNGTVLAQRAESDAQRLIASTETQATASTSTATTPSTTTTTTTTTAKAKPKAKSKKVAGAQQ